VNKSFTANGYNAVITKMIRQGARRSIRPTWAGAVRMAARWAMFTGQTQLSWIRTECVCGRLQQFRDFPVTAGAYQAKNNGSINITVSKLNPTATALIYSTYLGGNTISYCEGLAVDSAGNAYVAGYTSDQDFPVTKGAFQTVNKADTNTADSANRMKRLSDQDKSDGTGLVYSTYLGGSTGPWGGRPDLRSGDRLGRRGVCGWVGDVADFPVTSNAYQPKNKGASHCCDYTAYTSNGFLTMFNPAGTALIYSTYFGGLERRIRRVRRLRRYGVWTEAGRPGRVYLVGYTTSSNFPVTVTHLKPHITRSRIRGLWRTSILRLLRRRPRYGDDADAKRELGNARYDGDVYSDSEADFRNGDTDGKCGLQLR